ncbi:MAG: calpastatin [Nitrospira sp. SG-bin1]|nr:MAG: calpastatin [Nitrospira sp. SG-bin1]
MTDKCHLQRFLDAQAPVYDTVLAELRAGRKSSHWIWFIFPQIAGLGHSAMAQQFAITSLDEAKAYLQHPVLGQRLRECTQLVMNVEGRSAEEIFSYPDNLKFRSCMTLFMTATTDNALFNAALLEYFDGKPDQLTMNVLARHNMPRC